MENEDGGVAPMGRIESKLKPVSQLAFEINAEIQWSFASNPSMYEIPEIDVSLIKSLPTPNAQMGSEGVTKNVPEYAFPGVEGGSNVSRITVPVTSACEHERMQNAGNNDFRNIIR